MGKRDVTEWKQKGTQNIKVPDVLASTDTVDKFRDLAGKAGLLMCAGAVVAVLAKAVKNGGLVEYQEDAQDSEKPGSGKPESEKPESDKPDSAETESDKTESDKTE